MTLVAWQLDCTSYFGGKSLSLIANSKWTFHMKRIKMFPESLGNEKINYMSFQIKMVMCLGMLVGLGIFIGKRAAS